MSRRHATRRAGVYDACVAGVALYNTARYWKSRPTRHGTGPLHCTIGCQTRPGYRLSVSCDRGMARYRKVVLSVDVYQ